MRTLIYALLLSSSLGAQVGPRPDVGHSRSPEVRLSGRVVDGGSAVADATVTIAYRRYPMSTGLGRLAQEISSSIVKSDAQGRWSVKVPAWRNFCVWASKGNRLSPLSEGIKAPKDGLDLALSAATPLRAVIRVDGKAPGRAIPLRVVRHGKDGVPLSRDVESKPDGSVVVDDLPNGEYRVSIGRCGLYLPEPMYLSAGKQQTIDLARGIDLTVALVDAVKKPVAAALVELQDPRAHGQAKSDARGIVRLTGLEPGHGATLRITPPKPYAKQVQALIPGLDPRAASPQHTVSLLDGKSTRGRIVDDQLRPVAGVPILAKGTIHNFGYAVEDVSIATTTDKDGRFAIEQLHPNTVFSVYALHEDGELHPLGSVDPTPGKDPNMGDVAIGHRRVEITAKIEAQNPSPFELRIYGPASEGTIDKWATLLPTKTGTWLSPSLRPGEYVVFAVSRTLGIGRTTLRIRASTQRASESVSIRLVEKKRINGTVRGPDRKPVEGVTLRLASTASRSQEFIDKWADFVANKLLEELFPPKEYPRSVTTGKNGSFVIWSLEASGRYALLANQGRDTHGAGPGEAPPQEGGTVIEGVNALKLPLEVKMQAR